MAKQTLKIDCLMSYRTERGIKEKPERNEDDEKKKNSLQYEMNVITQRYKNQKFKR